MAARFSDLHWQAISPSDIRLESVNPSLAVYRPNQTDDFWKGEVAVGGNSFCGFAAIAEWSTCGIPLAFGKMPVNIQMHPAIDMTLSFSEHRLAEPNEPAAKVTEAHTPHHSICP